jgi:hypothetical protein
LRRTMKLVASAVVLLSIAAACGGGDEEEEAAPTAEATEAPTAEPTAAATEEAEPTPEPEGDVYPLTGEAIEDPAAAERPALAMKMDNVAEALPQWGIASADIIVEELVEGGLTRLVPVFHSELPDQIGPVRSGRSSDPDIAAAFNRPLFAWWGAMDVVKAEIAQAEADGKLIDVGIDRYPGLYTRDTTRAVDLEHTGVTNPNDLLDQVTDGEAPTPIFGWLDADEVVPEAASEEAPGLRLEWGGINGLFAWNADDETWRHFQWGVPHADASGEPVAVANVVVLRTPYQPSAARPDSPQALTVGEGEAWVFTDGRVTAGTWERAEANGPWVLTDADGNEILLRRGPTYIALFDGEPAILAEGRATELLDSIEESPDAASGDAAEEEG